MKKISSLVFFVFIFGTCTNVGFHGGGVDFPLEFEEFQMPVATNLNGISDWSTQWPFANAFKNARAWISQEDGQPWGQGPELDLDDFGYIRFLPEGVWAEAPVINVDGQAAQPGHYVLLYDGQGDISINTWGNQTPSLVSSEPGRIEISVERHHPVWVRIHSVNPENYPRNFRLMMPGMEHRQEELFSDVFLESIEPYAALRFMDWMQTNNSNLVSWDERALLPDATWATHRGVPYEVLIELSNITGKSPWFCVPHQAEDSFVTQLAILIRDQLDPGIPFYLEYSNETWNNIFEQHHYAQEQGLNLGLSGNPFQAGLFYHSRRAVEIFELFEEAFGGTQRFVRVLSSQSHNPWTMEQVVGFEDAWEKADAYSIAPYFGGGFGDDENTADLSLDELMTLLGEEIQDMGPLYETHMQYLEPLGLELLAYEGGQHLAGVGPRVHNDVINDLFHRANRDPRMEKLYSDYFHRWYESGAGLFFHFIDVSPFGIYGRWGALEYQDQDPSQAPKYRAIMRHIQE